MNAIYYTLLAGVVLQSVLRILQHRCRIVLSAAYAVLLCFNDERRGRCENVCLDCPAPLFDNYYFGNHFRRRIS